MGQQTYIVSLVGLGVRTRSLRLRRLATYLRFVIRGADGRSLDALDQIDDAAEPGETIIPAKIEGDVIVIHVDRTVNGQRVGQWRQYAKYVPVHCDLTQEQLADFAQWSEWCYRQVGMTAPEA